MLKTRIGIQIAATKRNRISAKGIGNIKAIPNVLYDSGYNSVDNATYKSKSTKDEEN